jgi:hypothetical protein
MDEEQIFKKGTEYANKHWNVLKNPNEHDNAREDFINGALEVVKNIGVTRCCESDREKLNYFRQWLIDKKKNIHIYQCLIDEYLNEQPK